METKTCRACGARVIFARHSVTRNVMILDAETDKKGIFYMTPGGFLRAWKEGDPDTRRYTSHHATCPEAERFRRKSTPEPSFHGFGPEGGK